MFALSLLAWFLICLVALPVVYAVVSGLYRSKMRKRRLVAEFRRMRDERRAAWAQVRA